MSHQLLGMMYKVEVVKSKGRLGPDGHILVLTKSSLEYVHVTDQN